MAEPNTSPIAESEDLTTNEAPVTMTPAMLQLIVTQILGKVNERIAGRIVTSISDASDDNHVPSALAVFNFLRTLTPGMSCQTVVGSMDTITDPDPKIIYLQKDDEANPTWTMYLWVADAWVDIGDTSIDLVNYWSKSDADIAELREKILGQEGLDAIKGGLDLTNVLRNDEASKEIVTGWMTEYLGTDMTNIVTNVMTEVEKVYVKKEELPAMNISVITEKQITAAVNGAFAATEPQI